MELSPTERNYLGLLVEFDAAPGIASRRAVLEQILASDRYGRVVEAEQRPEADIEQYLAHWYIPAIRELAAIPGFRADPEWIARTLRPSISVADAAAALDTLVGLDFLVRERDGTVVPREVRFRTATEAMQAAVTRFYRHELPEMLRRVDYGAPSERHLGAATFAMDIAILPEMKARVSTFVNQLSTLADGSELHDGQRVYQLVVQLVPVSETVAEAPEPSG